MLKLQGNHFTETGKVYRGGEINLRSIGEFLSNNIHTAVDNEYRRRNELSEYTNIKR